MTVGNLARYRRLMLVIPLVSAILLFFLAFLYFENEKRLAENESYRDLRSIGRLKATQISSWYNERYRDAAYFSTSNLLLSELNRLDSTGHLEREPVLKLFETVRRGRIYEEILVVDLAGKLLFSVDQNYQIDPVIRAGVVNAIISHKISTHNIYYCSVHQTIHNDVIAPLISNDTVKGILIMRINPYDFLYPYIQEWPVPSLTAETILATRRGDSAIFLNEMKKVSNLALKLTVPLTDTVHPTVAAIFGKTGRFSGLDYVGDKVLSDLSRIEGTPWYMIVKIDKSEVNDEVLLKTGMFLGMAILMILLITGGLIFGYKRRQELNQRLKDNADHEKFSEELKNKVSQRTSELQRSNEDLLNFTHIISHDLKEPVRKVRFFLSLFKDKYAHENKKEADEYLKKIESSVERLNAMVEGILNYSEVQDTHLGVSEIDLNDCMKKIKSDLELLIESKEAEVSVNAMPRIEGINILIYKLFYNLVENALKFSKPDVKPKITVDYINRILNGKKYVEISVSDNGIGFEPEYADKIFQSFIRLHPKDTYEGTGLGLTLCKRIAERHKGNIVARGNSNDGATFHVLLPVKQEN